MYTIQIVGAGYAGTQIADFFRAKKQRVFALTRSIEKSAAFRERGIFPIVADLTRPETLKNIPPAHFVVICAAPDAVPSSSSAAQPRTVEQVYEEIYIKGIGNYLNAIKKNPRPHFIVHISSTGIWQDNREEIVDESVLPQPQSAKAKILAAAEKQILECGLPAAILRLSGIYGPGRNRLSSFRKGEWPSGNNRWMNIIHVEDIAAMLPEFFKNAREGEIYIGTDDEPFRASSLAEWLAEKTGEKREFSFECTEGGRRLKNDKLKKLGIRLKYPTFREGYAHLLSLEAGESR